MYFTKIKRIKLIGKEQTYDLNVPIYHNFVLSNGIVSHNSAKSTMACTIAKYIDPTFPGELLNDGTSRRTCDRIVFTFDQFNQVVDNSKPAQAIVFDEAVLAAYSQDAGSEIQKTLIKKMVTIRKKRLFIIFVIPSIFMLRMYFAVFRLRALIHMFTPDGIQRGFFKFYSYEKKRRLYIYGKKEFNQDCVRPDFLGRSTNTEGMFFDVKEYDDKKEVAIKNITSNKKENKTVEEKLLYTLNYRKVYYMRNSFLYFLYDSLKERFKEKGETFSRSNYYNYLSKKYPQIMFEVKESTFYSLFEEGAEQSKMGVEEFHKLCYLKPK